MNKSSTRHSPNDNLDSGQNKNERNIGEAQTFLERIEKVVKEFKEFNKKAKEYINSAKKRNSGK